MYVPRGGGGGWRAGFASGYVISGLIKSEYFLTGWMTVSFLLKHLFCSQFHHFTVTDYFTDTKINFE
jgi:hypothetical protein